MASSLFETVYEYMRSKPEEKFSSKQLGVWYCEEYKDRVQEKIRRTSVNDENEARGQIVREISSQLSQKEKINPQIKISGSNPVHYYYTALTESEESLVNTNKLNELKIDENALYSLLAEYLWSEYSLYSKRIDDRRATNRRGKGGNIWLYPDVVSIENMGIDWIPEIKDCARVSGSRRCKLWSFEVKLFVNTSKIREYFYQAVSNSSWANFGYLVAPEIDKKTLKELRILTSNHDIGFIELNVENPAESQILIPAKEKTEVNWSSANRLAEENPDFRDCITSTFEFFQSVNPSKEKWPLTPTESS